MAVPTPRTWVAAELVTATIMNADQRDTDNFILAPPRAFAYRSAALTCTDSTWTLVGLDAEVYDPYATPMHDNTTNNSRMVAPETGLYQVNLKVRFNNDNSGRRFFELRKNAAGSQASGTLITTQATNATTTNSTTMNETVEVQLNATDYVELFAEQIGSVTNPLGLTTGTASTFLQVRFVAKQ